MIKDMADSALILGGGQSTRMGYDKKHLELDGVNVMTGLITKLHTLFSEVLISSNNPFIFENVITLHDELGEGPLAGIYQGLKYCKSEYLYVTACDMPFISIPYIQYIRNIVVTRQGDACVVRRLDGFPEPFNAFYSKRCLPYIYDVLIHREYRPRIVLEKLDLRVVDPSAVEQFNGNGDMFFNINCQKDLEQITRRYI